MDEEPNKLGGADGGLGFQLSFWPCLRSLILRAAAHLDRYATPSAMEKEFEARRVAAVEYRD
jgi:hypothetical protein